MRRNLLSIAFRAEAERIVFRCCSVCLPRPPHCHDDSVEDGRAWDVRTATNLPCERKVFVSVVRCCLGGVLVAMRR
jgi:hypothetical protein